jgi:hypothetical protein
MLSKSQKGGCGKHKKDNVDPPSKKKPPPRTATSTITKKPPFKVFFGEGNWCILALK